MKVYFFLFLLFCFNLFSSIEGILVDQKGNPLSRVEVQLKDGPSTITDEEGRFSFPLKEGVYEVIILNGVYKINFKDYLVKIIIKTFGEEVTIEPPGATSSYVPNKIMEIPKATLSENLTLIPNIHLNGLGGAFQTISISGMAKQRVQVEVMGYKIEGLRRAGTDFGTFHPDLFTSLNLYETGLGFTHGSNAMGAAVDFEFPQIFKENLSAHISYGTNNKNKSISALYSNEKLNIFTGYQEADYYWDGAGEKQLGYFKRANLVGSFKFEGVESINFLDFLLTRGWDIGKPFLSSDKTDYPENNLHILGLRGSYKNLNYQFGTYYQDLETTTTKERSFFKSLNIQGKLFYFKEKFSFGFETNSYPLFYANNRLTSGFYDPLKDASKYDLSLFSSYENYLNKSIKLFAGLRVNYFNGTNKDKEKEETIPGLFLKISKEGKINFDFSIYNIYRFPSIEELFYTGMTARGYVQGNENLKSEKGYGISLQLRKKFNKNEAGLSISYKDAKNYIERYKVSKDLYSYKNTDEVEILSGSLYLQGEFYFLNISSSRGENKKTGEDIDDQKPLTLNAGFYKKFSKFEPFLFFTLSDKLKNPGPNEVERDGYFVLNLGTNFYLNENMYFSFKIENLTDENYIPQGDEKAVPQMGRSFLLSFYLK
ncbi:MAG: TonB-dependent receptor [Thermoanaerobaculia bacterium]